MFCCVIKHLHPPEIWTIPSVNKYSTDSIGCFICLLNQLSNSSVTCVQKQVALQIILTLFNDEDAPIWNACRQNPSVGYQIIDAAADLQAIEPLQDVIGAVCSSAVDRLMKQDGYNYLLAKFIDGVHTVNETSIQFCMNVVSSLLPLNPVYVEALLTSYDDLISPLLEKAVYMDEAMTVSLILMLVPAVKHAICFTARDGNGAMFTPLLPLVSAWLNTSQSLDLKTSVLRLLKELCKDRESVLSLLSFGEANCHGDDDILSQTLTPPDCPFLLGLKRMMTCKESELTFHCVECLIQVLEIVHEPHSFRQVMASDLPGIDATIKAVKEAINNQRLSVAISGLHLLWCMLDRQPETMPLLLNNSWASCLQLICQALQNENQTIFTSGLKVAASFLRPQHQKNPVDVQAILSFLCMVENKTQMMFNRQPPDSSTLTSKHDSEIHTRILSGLMDIFVQIISLFQLDLIFQGNDRQQVLELKHVLQSVATDLMVNKKIFRSVVRTPDTVGKYLKCVDATIFIQLFIQDNDSSPQSSNLPTIHEFFSLLWKAGLPWYILGFSSSVRCSSLEEQAAKLVAHILSSYVEILPPALHVDPEIFYLGLIQLEWTDEGLSLDSVSSEKNALFTELIVLYLSYLNGYRPWALDQVFCFLCQVFRQFPCYISWHPIILRASIYFLAISENVLQDMENILTLKYETAVIADLEKTSIDLWYPSCVEILSWTLSSHTRHRTVGTKTVEYWIHQLNLMDKAKEEMETAIVYLKDCLPFYQTIVDLLTSDTAGKMAGTVLIRSLRTDLSGHSKEMILQWSHEKLEYVFSRTPDVNETAVDHILSMLCVLIDRKALESGISYLHNVKVLCQCAKYLTHQESESMRMMNAVSYLSALVKKLTAQESKIVIPPLMQNTKISAMLQSTMSKCNSSMLPHVLTLSAWFAIHGTDYQAPTPLILTTKQMLSFLASCQMTEASDVLRLVKSALIVAQSGNQTSSAVAFVKNHNVYISTHEIFNDSDILQIYWYSMQYLAQDTSPQKEIAFDIMETILTHSQNAHLCVHNPWNSVLMENIFSTKADASLSQVDLQLCTLVIMAFNCMLINVLPYNLYTYIGSSTFFPTTCLPTLGMSASEDLWTTTSANSFLLALTTSDLESLSVPDVKSVLSKLKQTTGLCDPSLLLQVEKMLESESAMQDNDIRQTHSTYAASK